MSREVGACHCGGYVAKGCTQADIVGGVCMPACVCLCVRVCVPVCAGRSRASTGSADQPCQPCQPWGVPRKDPCLPTVVKYKEISINAVLCLVMPMKPQSLIKAVILKKIYTVYIPVGGIVILP